MEAAYTLGASDLRIIARHILPNTLAPILVIGSSQFATMVLLESGLSFLGMGIQAPQPSWGLMLAGGPGLSVERVVARDDARRRRSRWWCWGPICWATGCGICSTRGSASPSLSPCPLP